MPRFVSRFIAKELRNARRRWVQGFRTGRAWLAVPITAASMYVLWNWAFGLGSYFGTSFAIAAALAILRGHIFTHPFRLVLVAVAVVIGTLVIPTLGADAWQALRRGDNVTAMVLAGVVALAWLLKKRFETGRMGLSRRKR